MIFPVVFVRHCNSNNIIRRELYAPSWNPLVLWRPGTHCLFRHVSVSMYIVNDYIKNENTSIMFSFVYVEMLCTFWFQKAIVLCIVFVLPHCVVTQRLLIYQKRGRNYISIYNRGVRGQTILEICWTCTCKVYFWTKTELDKEFVMSIRAVQLFPEILFLFI
jgi:hypothetical protein